MVDYVHGAFAPRPNTPVPVVIWHKELTWDPIARRYALPWRRVPNFKWHPGWGRLLAWDGKSR